MKSNKKSNNVNQAKRGSKTAARKSQKVGRKAAPVSKGLGGYMVKAPKLSATSDGSRISHREFITDVTGQVAFTSLGFPINAGRDTTFQWLADLATRYERYEFDRLRFVYEPRCSTATAGTVILAVDYDCLDGSPVSKQVVYTYHHCAQSAAWDECCLEVDPAVLRSRGPLFSRAGAAPTVSDLKTYDIGSLWLCTSGFNPSAICGELFVEYSVRLSIPQTTDNVQGRYYQATAGLAAGSLVGTGGVFNSQNLDIAATNASTFTLNQSWCGLATVVVVGTGLATGGFATTGTAVAAIVSEVYNAAGTSGTLVVRVPASSGLRNNTIILGITATTVTLVNWYFSAYQN